MANIKTSAKSLVDFIRIPLGEDMKSETYKIPGNYVCVADATATTLINCPLKTSFFLTVQDNDGDILQTFTEWRGQSVVMRTYYTHSSKWLGEYAYVTTSDFECIDCSVNATGDHTIAIPNSPKEGNWIPIILGADRTLDISRITVYRDWNNGWFIRSTDTTNQYIYIRFYKYPV